MSSMTRWGCLLGLPLEDAVQRARAAGVEPVVSETCAPRRGEVGAATHRVIRVVEGEDGLRLVVSAFMDGDPRKEI